MVRFPGRIAAGSVSNEIVSHRDWLPTILAAAGEPDIAEKLKKGHKVGNTTYKVHLDGYNLVPQTNEQFARFVADTSYVTQAERAPNAKDFPGAPAENLVHGDDVGFRRASVPFPYTSSMRRSRPMACAASRLLPRRLSLRALDPVSRNRTRCRSIRPWISSSSSGTFWISSTKIVRIC